MSLTEIVSEINKYVVGTHKLNMIYRIAFSLMVYVGATQSIQLVWGFSDIANALMAIPNLICLLVLSNVIAKETERFQPIIDKEKRKLRYIMVLCTLRIS